MIDMHLDTYFNIASSKVAVGADLPLTEAIGGGGIGEERADGPGGIGIDVGRGAGDGAAGGDHLKPGVTEVVEGRHGLECDPQNEISANDCRERFRGLDTSM